MSKPVLLAVDDDIAVLETVVQDLRRQYGSKYRILRAGSGQSALETCEQLLQRDEVVALLLSDQRMPGMTGVEFLEKAARLYPDAKRSLLTAYADTEAAIRAINTARIHYYLTKPWDPPEEKLYPVIDDLLGDWQANYRPPFDGIRVIGNRWGSKDHMVRSFLSQNQVPYVWMSPEQSDVAVGLLDKLKMESSQLPVVLFPDGSTLSSPTQTELAGKIGLSTHALQNYYDMVVIGAGPAGLAAAVYGTSEGLSVLAVEPNAPGGQAGSSSRIENYLGFPAGLSGQDLARRARDQAVKFGTEFLTQCAESIKTENGYHIIRLADGQEVSCRVCLIATGVDYRKLATPGLAELTGRGVYYGAALTEARACQDEDVFIVGGANSAGQAAMYFSQFARSVTMLVRGEGLEQSMSKYLIDQITATSNIKVEIEAQIVEAIGHERLEAIDVSVQGSIVRRPTSSVFIFIGAAPQTAWLPNAVMRDSNGFVLSGSDMKIEGKLPKQWIADREPYLLETSVPGIFVAGDVRHGSVKRVASAVGEGSIVVQFVHQYLARF